MNVEEILTGEELEALVRTLRGALVRTLRAVPEAEQETLHYHVFAAYATKMKERGEQSEYVCFARSDNRENEVFWEVGTLRNPRPTLENLADKLAKYVPLIPLPTPREERREDHYPLLAITYAPPYSFTLDADITITSRRGEEGQPAYFGRPLEIAGWRIQEIIDIPPEHHYHFESRLFHTYQHRRFVEQTAPAAEPDDDTNALSRFDGEGGTPGGK